ncbi:MAG TPA: GldG family protein, partial [Gemmatimonadaceae bacterium]|nr:GldG family protein [Gemmatimonadaceae bacterium]
VAIGLWASSITRHQITSFILAASVNLAVLLIGLPIVTLGLGGTMGSIAALLSVLPHFTNVARGVVDLRDVLYFASTAGLFLVLAGLSLLGERLSRTRGAYRRLKLGVAIVVGGVVVLNVLGGFLHGRLDLTRDRLYTLSRETRSLVRGLQDVAQVRVYVSRELPPEQQRLERDVMDVLTDMQGASNGNLRVLVVDPENDVSAQDEAASLGIFPDTFNVRRSNQVEITRGWFGVGVLYAGQQRSIPLIQETDDLEYRLVSDLAAMASVSRPRVAFLYGFGAPALSLRPTLSRALTDRYNVSSIDLNGNLAGLTPDSVRAAILIGPTQPIDSQAVARLSAYIDGGGSALIMLQNVSVVQQSQTPIPIYSGLGPFLASHGIALLPGIVFDTLSNYRWPVASQGSYVKVPYPLWPIVSPASDHEVTRGLTNYTMSWAAPFAIRDAAHVVPLWKTTDAGGIRSPSFPVAVGPFDPQPSDVHGPQIVAVAVDPGAHAGRQSGSSRASAAGGRLVVVGSAYGLDENFVKYFPQDLVFAGNALDWLVRDETLIGIRSKHRTPPRLTFDSVTGLELFTWGNQLLIPLLAAFLGAVYIAGRGRRARLRWPDDAEPPPRTESAA